ncbi:MULTISPECIES: esterase family protein [Clostridia]|uniref:alpha/beta hydrolase n=1 Tax=Clostridia TaxID=186801 RepID=UPI0016556D13|nr:alpha/beta hydrolase-fold protein [Blautia faecis]MBC8613049.1 hypothetical protein [Blautia faecis]
MKKKMLLGVMALSLTLAAPCGVYAQDTNAAPATSEGLEAEGTIEIPEYETADYAEDFIYSKKDEGLDKLKKNACDEQGTVETLEYDTPAYAVNEILGTDETIHKSLHVYLPYNYDETKQYNILYLMHGGGDNQEFWLGDDNGGRPVFGETTRNVLDNMIKEGICDPVIVVTPTFYSPVEGKEITEEQAKEYGASIGEENIGSEADLFTVFFQDELRNDIIPMIESKYSTYAGGDTSEENLIATRDHRAYAGLSMGSITSVRSILMGCTDLFSYVGSYSGIKSNFDLFKSTMDEKYSDYDIKYWFNGEGVEDIAVAEHVAFYNDVKEQMSDKFVDGENLAMVMLEDGNHAWTSWITDLYNSLLVFFKK